MTASFNNSLIQPQVTTLSMEQTSSISVRDNQTSRMASTAASSLDVIARSLDLCRSLMDTTNSSGPVMNVVLEVGQWLGREKLNKSELQDCLQRARAIAVPNCTAQTLFDDIRSGIDASETAPFLPLSSGSLSNLMANDPNLCWMVSSVACLFQFHDMYDVTECVNNFILAAQPREEHVWDDARECAVYNPGTVHLRRIVSKLVSSIWFNIVNSKCITMELPEELKAVCHAGHNLKGSKFARLLNSLRGDRQKIMITSDHLLRNLTLWIMLHFDGRLLVVVGGNIIYDRNLGNSHREIELRVRIHCSGSAPCQEDSMHYELFEDIAGDMKSFLIGSYTSRSDFSERPMVRRRLYDIPDFALSGDRDKRHGLQTAIKCTCQSMMRWLLALSIEAPYESTNFGFSVALGPDVKQDESRLSMKDILTRSPSMLNHRWGGQETRRLVYAEPAHDQGIERSDDESEDDVQDPLYAPERSYEEVVAYFPILRDLLEDARSLCKCLRCYDTKKPSYTLVPGCLQHDTLIQSLTTLAHGVADGFGARDVSGTDDLNLASRGMLRLLLDVVENRGILWDTWFGVAASVILGCSCPFEPLREHAMKSKTTIVGVQYGDLAVLAPWLDLAKALRVQRCFCLTETRGKLSVTETNPQAKWRNRIITENYAVIQTEMTGSPSSKTNGMCPEPTTVDAQVEVLPDDSTMELDWILLQAEESQYRIMMRVRSGSHSRIVDPLDAMVRLVRSIAHCKCDHNIPSQSFSLGPENKGVLYNFSHVLGNWEKWDHSFRFVGHNPVRLLLAGSNESDTESQPESFGTIHITQTLDCYLKQNVALALSVNDIVILNDGSACFSCLSEQAARAPHPHPDLKRPLGHHYIINVDRLLRQNKQILRIENLLCSNPQSSVTDVTLHTRKSSRY